MVEYVMVRYGMVWWSMVDSLWSKIQTFQVVGDHPTLLLADSNLKLCIQHLPPTNSLFGRKIH